MTPEFPIATVTVETLPALAVFFVFGAALGAAYFSTLRISARLFSEKASLAAAALTVARFAVLAICLTFVSRAGALPLLVTAMGLVVARWFIVRRISRSSS